MKKDLSPGKTFLTSTTTRYPRGLPISAGELPSLRDFLIRMWTSDVFEHIVDYEPSTIAWSRDALERASLWWIATDMVEVLMAASRSIPLDVLATDIEPLDRCGLVVCERPWTGTPSTLNSGETEIAVDAFLWGPVRLTSHREGARAIRVSSYQFTTETASDIGEKLDPEMRERAAPFRHDGRFWYPLGDSDWPLDDELGLAPWPMEVQCHASFIEDRRVLCALNTLLAHGGIATTTLKQCSRGERRRAERAGDLKDRSYRIVTLRQLRDSNGERHEGERKIGKDHRWAVSGHWRRQPYGPGRTLRRLQWIHPYIKGPESKPIRPTEVVRAWRR